MPPVQFGLFDWIDRREAPLGQIYEERLQLLEAADSAGFVGYHLAEHHFTPLGMAPSPGIFLAAATQRTRRIRLGPLVYLLPLYNPVRLVQEICMLDHLSGGRLELGLGRGVSPYELGYHGVDAARSRDIFREALAVIISGLTHERLTYQGEHYHYEDVPVELSPVQKPYPPLWYATSTFDSVPWAAEQGFNLALLGPAHVARTFVDRYREVWEQHKDTPHRLNAHVREPKIAINRQVVVAETDAEAEVITRAVHPRWAQSFIKLWVEHGNTDYIRRVDLDAALKHETIIAGSPATVREQVARLIEVSGCTYIICCFAWGSLTHQQALRSLRLFADEVIPAFTVLSHRSPTSPPG